MKTYEEALDMLYGESPEAIASALDHAERSVEVAVEASESKKTHILMWALVADISGRKPGCGCQACVKAFDLAMTAYINGIRVGMEMEKQCEP